MKVEFISFFYYSQAIKMALVQNLAQTISKEFNGHQIRIDAPRQMICASDMCQGNPKKTWSNYRQNRQTEEYISELESSLGIPRHELIQSYDQRTPRNSEVLR